MNGQIPRVTVGLPVYNGQDFLAESIESMLAQTYRDFELIISDNASTDATAEICRQFAERDSRIRYHRETQNRGAMWNYNNVVHLARGEYFKWQQHDDLCDPTFLERCVEILDRKPAVVWCHSQTVKIDELGQRMQEDPEEIGNFVHTRHAGLPRKYHDSDNPSQRFKGVVLGTNWCADLYGLIRTETLRQTQLMGTCYGHEKVLIGELAMRGQFAEVPETLFFQRVHPGASGNNNSKAAQRLFWNPHERRCGTFPWMKLLSGHLRAIWRANLSFADRSRCIGVIAQYVLQYRKWRHVVRNVVTGAGVGHKKLSTARAGQGKVMS